MAKRRKTRPQHNMAKFYRRRNPEYDHQLEEREYRLKEPAPREYYSQWDDYPYYDHEHHEHGRRQRPSEDWDYLHAPELKTKDDQYWHRRPRRHYYSENNHPHHSAYDYDVFPESYEEYQRGSEEGSHGYHTGYGRDWPDYSQGGEFRGVGPKNWSRADNRILDDINERLTDDEWLDPSDVEVSVENGEVTLTGTVDSRESKHRAEDIAESVSGVIDIHNQLRVGLKKRRR